MSARRLEEFIGLIETAERVSGRRDSGSAYPKQVLKSSSSPSRGPTWQGSQDPGSSFGSVGVPRLALPSWSSSPTHPRLVGPPASHCGLSSISNFSTARDHQEASTERSTIPSTPMDTVRSSVMTEAPSTVRKGSQDIPPDIPKNLPFVRKILKEQHPAVPDSFRSQQEPIRRGSSTEKKKSESSSPQASSGTSRQASQSPEKKSPSKLPPKFPRNGSSGSSIRNSSNSPTADPKKKAGSREHSGSPSPVRKTPPKPSSPSHSYSTSFNSSTGSLSRSPSRSPVKSNTKLGSSKSSEKSIAEVLEPIPGSRTSREAMETRRKSWVAASSSRKTGNSQSSVEGTTSVTKSRSRTASPKENNARSRPVDRKPMPMKADFKVRGTKGKVVIQDDKPTDTPQSQAMVRRRPQSAPHRKIVKVASKSPEEPEAPLGDFSKSLKLLGVDIPSNRTEATKLNSQEVRVTTKEPTIRTRLLKRSGSYADLTQNIKRDMKMSEFEAVREKVKEAVFEQWYFKKCAEEKEKKLKQEEEAEKLRKEKEEKQKEVEEQSKEEFQKWCKQKREKAEKEKLKQEIADKGKVQKVVDQAEVDKKNKEWLTLKKKDQLKKKEDDEKRRLAEEKKKIEEDERRTQAEKTFLAWKEEKTKELKERYLVEKKKQKEKQEALEEKRKDADSAFIGWKNRKNDKKKIKSVKNDNAKKKDDAGKDIRDATEDKIDSNEEKVEKNDDENNNSKLEEAKRAYEAWLDLIEEREEENLLFEEERKRILMWKPPWYAGGKALF